MSATIFVDVEDIFRFAEDGNRRPQGIQRLAFTLCRALQQRLGPENRLRFLRHDGTAEGCFLVEWSTLSAVYEAMTDDAPAPRSPIRAAAGEALPLPEPPPEPSPPPGRTGLRAAAHAALGRLPPPARDRAIRYIGSEIGAMRAFAGLLAFRRPQGIEPAPLLEQPSAPASPDDAPTAGPRLAEAAMSGDVLLSPGASFIHAGYGEMIAILKQRHGLRFGVLLYDLIPVRRPEFTGSLHAIGFKTWLNATLPLADRIFAISRQVAADVEAYAASAGLPIRDPVRPIPIGTGFGLADRSAAPSDSPERIDPDAPALPAPGTYALMVATIEIRKNHILLMRVWRRLLEQMPAGTVPRLVFAGRVGWLVADLMQQLENSAYLDGHILMIDQPSDATLAELYRGCLFTLFPSLYEGWGLPVSESLSFGKPCIISNTTSLPEVAGDLALYIDPEDVTGATRVVRAILEDRPGLAQWEARVRRDHRPVSWDATAAAIMEGLDDPSRSATAD